MKPQPNRLPPKQAFRLLRSLRARGEGWGENPERIEALIRDDVEVLAMWREEMKSQGKRNLLNNVKEATAGNSRSYTVSRLQREAPELFAQVVAGTKIDSVTTL